MKIRTSFLAGVFLMGSVGSSAPALAADDGVLLKEGSGYCHMKFRAMEPRSLDSDADNPTLKGATSGDVIDFYGPCDQSPTGQTQVRQQKMDKLFWSNAR
jgi:hypothetical protein